MTSYKKPNGKSVSYTINEETRAKIRHMKESIQMNAEDNPHYKALNDKLNTLDEYDRNLLLAYFAFDKLADLSKTLGVSPSVILSKIKKIKQCLT